MNYEEFKTNLQEEIQARSLRHIEFLTETITKANETLEGLVIKFEGQPIAPTIYPKKMYESYKDGVSVSEIADYISPSILNTANFPTMPELTPENAEKSISFSLINKDRNKELLEQCPYKEVYDMAAIPRWHISDEASFVVNNNIMQTLRMTKEEILNIAQKNTESADYTCKRMDDVIRDIMLNDGVDEELIDEVLSMGASPLNIISNKQMSDGSCAVLSDAFMQNAAEQIGTNELYLLPSSRHEMLAIDAHAVNDSSSLKAMVMEVNSSPDTIKNEDFLSDSIYKYNAQTHSLSACDSKGLFHDKEPLSNAKSNISKGGRGKC